ncbi:MAG: 2-oxo acid dehydrogenase subunit E2, partial [Melioribacteraceae bacterium]|nr:2-oxo acid dehydrogenase subunit E2 [Melioribacteraceae bacterium]
MKVDVIMPKMGESINEGTIIKWHKQKGDKVEKDEIIFDISTDKVDTEIPSPASGVLVDVKVFEQETVDVDTVVAVIEANGESSGLVEKEEEKVEEIQTTSKVGGEIIDIPMPKMGESIMEGTIIKWHKQIGDKVEKDEIIFEISTDKVDTEVPSPVNGTLVEILCNENETVNVDTVVAKISSTGGKLIPIDKTTEVKKEKKNKAEKVVIEKKEKLNTSASIRFYSPLVMSIANKENVTFEELEKISGSGVNNRVTKRDILKYVDDRKHGRLSVFEEESKEEVKQVETKVETIRSDDEVEVIAMDNIRQRIMYHMVNSKETSVHVTAMIEVDMTDIYNYMQKEKDNFLRTEKIKLTYMPFISHAVIKSLKEFPLVNASI